MLKRLAHIALIAGGLVVLLMVLTMGWLKAHEDEMVFAAARGRQHLLTVLPADAQRGTVPEANGVALAALLYRAPGNAGRALLGCCTGTAMAMRPSRPGRCTTAKRCGAPGSTYRKSTTKVSGQLPASHPKRRCTKTPKPHTKICCGAASRPIESFCSAIRSDRGPRFGWRPGTPQRRWCCSARSPRYRMP